MKPYIMNYSKSVKLKGCISSYSFTWVTKTTEGSDDDYLLSDDFTMATETIENADEDFLFFNSTTIITRTIENEDNDY